jgi:hypothetical protein
MKRLLAVIAAGFVGAATFANPTPVTKVFQGLSDEERATLEQGHALIRQASSARSLSLAAPGAFADEIRARVRALGANYVGEVIMVVPGGAASSGSLEALAKDLANVEGYVGIPYRSKQSNRTYDLFDKMTIVERTTQSDGQTVVADQHMDPFLEYRAQYSYELEGVELHFRSENLTTISYRGFNAVGPGDMLWFLYGFPQDGAICLYGVGAVKAFDLFGLFGDRMKTSFMGRIQAFFSYLYAKRAEGNTTHGQ